MFYQTKLRSVNGSGATDVNGKHLRFIGFNPAQAGDTVWTDGKVIFGHAACRSTPLLPNVGGIPVLGEDVRGYVTKSGKFKNYSVANDDWIVNNNFFFFHGKSDINGNHIVDANISKDGELLIAAGGEYAKYNSISLNNQMWVELYLIDAGNGGQYLYNGVVPYGVLSEVPNYTGQRIVYGVDEPDEDKPLELYKNEQLISSISLKKYSDLAENLALKIKGQIMAESNKDEAAINYTSSSDPPNDFVAASYARVANVHVHDTGDLDAVIVSSAYGYCFPYQTFDGSVFVGSFYANQDKFFSKKLVLCMNNFETSVFANRKLPFELNIEQYPVFIGKVTDENGEYTEEYQQYILNKCAYYIPRARFRFYRWFPMLFSAVVIVRVHNDEVIDTIYSEAGGGTKFSKSLSGTKEPGYPFTHCWDERHAYNSSNDGAFVKHIQKIKNRWRFPLGDGFEFEADGLKFTAFIDTKNGTRLEVSDQENETALSQHYEAYLNYPLFTFESEVDSTLNNVLIQTGLPKENIIGSDIISTAPSYNFIDTQNDVSVDFLYPKKFSNCYLSGWFRYDDDAYQGNEIRLNHCLKRLGNDKILLGTKDGYLTKIDKDGTVQIVCESLKNFRLNELNFLSKAKK